MLIMAEADVTVARQRVRLCQQCAAMQQLSEDVLCWAQVRLQQVGDRGAAAAAEQLLRRACVRVPLRHDLGAQQVRPCHLLADAMSACLSSCAATMFAAVSCNGLLLLSKWRLWSMIA